jgi:hypothetical protein
MATLIDEFAVELLDILPFSPSTMPIASLPSMTLRVAVTTS